MIERYLKAKHWQVFILTFGLPFLIQFVMMFTIFSQLQPLRPGEVPEFQFNMFWIFGIVMLIYIVFLFGWYWSVAIGLKDRLPKELELKHQRFKLFFFSPLIYFCFLGFFMSYFLSLAQNNMEPSFGLLFPMILILILLHFYSIFCMIFIMYFTAKTIKSVELQREAHFSDYILYFFLIWFFPVGVWILQPKINSFVSGSNRDENLLDE